MPKRPINVSHLLRQAVTNMAGQANQALVGLVIRFNEDDTTIRDLWSEGSNAGRHLRNPDQADRAWVRRNRNDANLGLGTRWANKVADTAGYHAEELMIITWPALLRGAGLREDQVQSVDMVLSKSPCYGAAASSKLRLETQGREYGIGCANKLNEFIGTKRRDIQWRLAFLALAGSDAPDYAPVGGGGVDRLMSTRERELAAAAERQVAHRDVVAPAVMRQVGAMRGRAQTLQAVAPLFGGRERGALMTASGAINRQANQAATQVNQRTAQLFIAARTQSIGQAQHGITVLDQRVNVDVRRWVG